MSGTRTAGPKLTLIQKAPGSLRKSAARRKAFQPSVFRNWIEQLTLSMVSLEASAIDLKRQAARDRFRQLRRRFIRVQNEAYLCCVTLESKSSVIRRERAAYRIPKLMWLMIQIRRQAETLLGVENCTPLRYSEVI